MTPQLTSSTETPDGCLPRPPRLTYTCPHCGGELDLQTYAPPSATTSDPETIAGLDEQAVGEGRAGGQWLTRLGERFFPLSSALFSPQPRDERARVGVPRFLCGALLVLGIVLVLIWSLLGGTREQPAPAQSQGLSPTPAGAAVGAPQSLSVDQAAALAVVAAYNAADAKVAATLSLDPLKPSVDETGPLWERRSQALAKRKQTNATHTTRLLRWAVGAIVVDAAGTSATITTQETWEDQSENEGIRTATIRVSYTLRRANPQAAWKIEDATTTLL
jgi:hypothetical protein